MSSENTPSTVKPKLLISTDCFLPRKDGVSRFLRNIIPHLEKHFEITVLAPRYEGIWDQRPFANLTLVRYDLSQFSMGDFTLSKPQYSSIRKYTEQADIIWNQTLGPIGASTIQAAHSQGKHIVSYVHSRETELVINSLKLGFTRDIIEKVSKHMVRYLYNRCSLLMVPSKDTKKYITQLGVKTQMKIVQMGIDEKIFLPAESKTGAKESLRISPSTFVVGYTGRIAKEKDLQTLSKAFDRFNEKVEDAMLLIVGDGPEEYKKTLTSKRIRITGFVQNVVPFLQAMDVFVLPSLTETSSLSTMEAMACEVPVIVTPVGHIRDYIENTFNGLMFQKRDIEGLESQLTRIYKDRILRKRMRVTGRKTIITKYTEKKMVRNVISLLLEQVPK